MRGPRLLQPDRLVWEAAAAVPFTAFCAAANVRNATAKTAAGYAVMGHPGTAPHGYEDFSYGRRLNRGRTKRRVAAVMARARRRLHRRLGLRRVDRRLAPGRALPRRRRATPSVVVLERGQRFGHTDFRQSMDVDHLSDVYELIQGQGAQVVAANLVGGGSNLYLAASLRSPTETFERTRPPPRRRAAAADVAEGDSPQRRSTATTGAPRRGCACAARAGTRSRSRAASGRRCCARPGYTCDRVPLAIDLGALRQREVVPHRLHLRRQELADHQLPRRRPSAPACEVRPLRPGRTRSRQSSARPYRYVVHGVQGRSGDASGSAGPIDEIECKVADPRSRRDGNAADPDALAAERRLPSLSAQVGRAPRRQRRPRRRDRVRPAEGPAACSGCPATTSSTRASRSRR